MVNSCLICAESKAHGLSMSWFVHPLRALMLFDSARALAAKQASETLLRIASLALRAILQPLA